MSRDLLASRTPGPLRFLTLISTLTRGGTERAAVNYALGYKAQGHASAVLAYGGSGPRQSTLEAAAIEMFIGGHTQTSVDEAVHRAREWKPDIVHLHRPGIPDSRSAKVVRSLIHPGLRVFETNVFGYVDDSPDRELFDVHLQLSRWCMWKWRRAAKTLKPNPFGVVVPYAVDVQPFRPLTGENRSAFRASLGLPPNAVVLGRIGQTDLIKWSPALIDSFAEVAQRHSDTWLMVVGLPEELKTKVTALPENLRARILRLPMVDGDEELGRRYSAMDVFVHTSQKGESFGMVLCEAMLNRLPVITLSTPLRDNSQIEVVRNLTSGLVVDSPEGLTRAMLQLVNDSDLRQRLGQAGPRWVNDHFSIAVVAPRLVRLAQLALAAGSSQELAATIAHSGDFRTSLEVDTPASIRRDSALAPSAFLNTLASLINSRALRLGIKWIRQARSRFRPTL